MTAPEPIPAPRKKRLAPNVAPPEPTVVGKDTYKESRRKPETPLEKRLAARVGTTEKRHEKLILKPRTLTEIVDPITAVVSPLRPRQPGPGSTAMSREAWLIEAIHQITFDQFTLAGIAVPPVRVSIGWPGGRGKKTGVIGQCWFGAAVSDGLPALFISPVLKDEVVILATLTHEMAHAALGLTGHRANFAKMARKVGLQAPWPATTATPELAEYLKGLAEDLGPFPHGQINPGHGLLGSGPERPPIQTTRMLKLVCVEDGYTVRTTQKWIDEGLPSCPEGHLMEREL